MTFCFKIEILGQTEDSGEVDAEPVEEIVRC